jgi:hypothetical protein
MKIGALPEQEDEDVGGDVEEEHLEGFKSKDCWWVYMYYIINKLSCSIV